MKVSPARSTAFDALLKIENDSAFSSVVLPQVSNGLSQKDKALCYEIVLGALRRQIYLDRLIDHFATKGKLDIEVRLALRIGIFQLLSLDRVPAYSILNESVNLVQRAKKTSAKGLVNAILRRVSRETVSFVYADELERISVETSHPMWLIEKWTVAFGIQDAESLAVANNAPPKNAFRFTARSIKNGLGQQENWIKSEIVDGCFSTARMDDELFQLAQSGDIYFQDEASQLVASAVKLSEDESFLDVCAAPGGKTSLIASRRDFKTKLIVAGDLPWSRVEFLRETCRKQEIEVSVVQYDATHGLPFADASFDTILLDAPCSGTGTVRHNPEIRYSLKPGDITELSSKQLQILTSASKLVKPGGRIYYSTCSLEPEENEGVISNFLGNEPDFAIVSADLDERFRTPDGFTRTSPDRDNMDGFFLSVLRKIKDTA